MLERLRLRNFQRHEDLRIVFDERVTTFVGTSDVGKSSILRALKWAMTNRPSGSDFVRHGAKEASATLWLDGHRLCRRKGKKGVNKLVLDGAELEAFGSELPEPVRQLSNVDVTNFQGQHDPPFWLSLTAGQASKELNAVVNLDEIDRVLSTILKTERRARTETELCEKRVEEAERDSEALRWVSEMETEWREMEEKQKSLNDMEGRLERSKELLDEVERLRRRAEADVPDTEELDGLIAELREADGKLKTARDMRGEIYRLSNRAESCGEEIDDLQTQLLVESGGICPLCGGALEC